MRNVMVAFLALTFLSLALASRAAADVIRLKSGRVLVGTVVDKKADPVQIRTRYGLMSFLKSEIKSIEIKPTPWDEFDRRLRKVDKKDPKQLLALLEWARQPENEKYLKGQVRRLYQRILRVDPENEEAHLGLGHRKHEGRWVTRKEYERIKQAQDENRSAKNKALVEREKREAYLRRAKQDVGLQMKLNKKADKEAAKELNDECGVEMHVATSRRISVAGTFERTAAKPLLQLGEKALTQVCTDLKLGGDYNPGRAGMRSVYHHYFGKLNDRKALITFVRDRHGGISKAFYIHLMKGQSGLSANSGRPVAVAVDRGDTGRKDSLLHNLGHCIAGSLCGDNKLAPWLQEGFGMYMSIRFLGNTGTFCTTMSKYAQELEVAKKRTEEGWALVAKEQVQKGHFPRFRGLSVKELNLLDAHDLARSWALCRFFMARSPKNFRNYMRYTGKKAEIQERAIKAAFGIQGGKIDDTVNKWILENF